MNITDVEDKIIKRAREAKMNPPRVDRQIRSCFLEDLKTLNCSARTTPARYRAYPEIISLMRS